jgi:hypothetical protein
MPFQTRRSATLAPERIIKLLIPSVDIWQPPPAQPTAEAGGGSQGISVRYPYLSKPHIQWYAGTYPHIYIQWYPIYISNDIHIYPILSSFSMDIQDIFTYLHIRCYPDRYPHKISMFGYVTIHMDNIGYVMDISWKSVRISMQDICTRYPCLDMFRYMDI